MASWLVVQTESACLDVEPPAAERPPLYVKPSKSLSGGSVREIKWQRVQEKVSTISFQLFPSN